MGPSNHEIMKQRMLLFFTVLTQMVVGQEISFQSWDELSKYVNQHGTLEQISQKQLDLAELTEKAAVANVFNPRIPITGSAINNTQLPVSFIPAEAFGGPVGSFREITLGQPYITSFTATPQFDIINVAKWQEVKLAKANTQWVAAEIALNKKKLLEQTNALYCNILLYQQQEKILSRFVEMADSLVFILENKHSEGLVRIQDLNDAKVYQIQQTNALRNVQNALQHQLGTLSGICQREVTIEIPKDTLLLEQKATSLGDAEVKYALFKYQYAALNQRVAVYDQLPVLSFQSSLAYQNNSHSRWVDPANRWIYSSFIGMKIAWDFPTNAVKYTNVRSKKLNAEIQALSWEEEKRNTAIRNQQVSADYQKALGDYQSALEILALDKNTFFHQSALFQKDLIPLDKLLQSQKKWLASELDGVNARVNMIFQKNKISINNAD